MTTGTPGETVERETAALWGFALVPGYREVRQLGAGHTGRVFLATYQATGAYVAIKYLNATLRRDTEFMDRFRVDAPSLVELDDPNVVQLYEYVETPTRAAVVMELVDGVSLRTILAEHGRTSPEAALAVLKSTLSGAGRGPREGRAAPGRQTGERAGPGGRHEQADRLRRGGSCRGAGGARGQPAVHVARAVDAGGGGAVRGPLRGGVPAVRDRQGAAAVQGGGRPSLRDKHLVEPVPLEVAPDSLRDLLRRGLAKDPAVRYASARQFAAELEEDALAGYGPGVGEARAPPPRRAGHAARAPLPAGQDRHADRHPGGGPRPADHRAQAAAAPVDRGRDGRRRADRGGAHRTGCCPPALRAPYRCRRRRRPSQLDPTPVDDKTPVRRPRRPAVHGQDGDDGRSRPPPSPTRPPRFQRARAHRLPAVRPALPSPAVRSADIVQWTGSAGAVRVAADGRGPVRLRITYTRRDGDGQARTVGTRRPARSPAGPPTPTPWPATWAAVGCGKQGALRPPAADRAGRGQRPAGQRSDRGRAAVPRDEPLAPTAGHAHRGARHPDAVPATRRTALRLTAHRNPGLRLTSRH